MSFSHPSVFHLQQTSSTKESDQGRTSGCAEGAGSASLERRDSRRGSAASASARAGRRSSGRCSSSGLGSGDRGDGGDGCGGGSAEGLSGVTELGDLVLDRGLLVAVGAVVVADEDVSVDVAHADEVVWLLVARVDTRLVSGDAGVNDAAREC